MDCSMPGFPVLHYLLEFAQTHVYWVDNAIQPSPPLLTPSPPPLSLSQPPVSFPLSWVFAWSGGQSIGASASVLPMDIQGWFPLGLTGFISLLSKGLSGVFSSTTVRILWVSAFFMVQLSHPYMCSFFFKTNSITPQPLSLKHSNIFLVNWIQSRLPSSAYKALHEVAYSYLCDCISYSSTFISGPLHWVG